VDVRLCGFSNLWVCVCLGMVMCGYVRVILTSGCVNVWVM